MVAQTNSTCGLMLFAEAGAGARAQLEAALGAGAVAAVCVLPAAARDFDAKSLEPLVGIIQKSGAAALIADDAKLVRSLKADGVHLTASRTAEHYGEARGLLGNGSIVGADAGRSRDAAMRLGEAGADYIGFGAPHFVADRQAARDRRLGLVEWWAEIFEVPCVALDVDSPEDAEALARVGADFVAMRIEASLAPADVGERTSALLALLAPGEA